MIINDVIIQDRGVIPLTIFEEKGIRCYGKIPLDDRLSPETIKLFPKERYATLYRSPRLSDYVILNSTYEQLSVFTVKILSYYSYDILNTLHDKFYFHKENTTEYAIDENKVLHINTEAAPLYQKIEQAIFEKQRKQKLKNQQLEVINKANKLLKEKKSNVVYKSRGSLHYLFNLSPQGFNILIKNNDFFKKNSEIHLEDILSFLNISYNGDNVIYQFERLYTPSELLERYNFQFRHNTFYKLLKDVPNITLFSRKYYRETDILEFDDLICQRYNVLPEKD